MKVPFVVRLVAVAILPLLMLLTCALLLAIPSLFLLQVFGMGQQLLFLAIAAVGLVIGAIWWLIAFQIRYAEEHRSDPLPNPGSHPQTASIVPFVILAGIVLVVGTLVAASWKKTPRVAYKPPPSASIQSVTCRREGDDAVVEVSLAGGQAGAYRLQVDLSAYTPPVLIARRVRTVALGDAWTERLTYRETELESLCVQRARAAGESPDSLVSLDVVATLARWKEGGPPSLSGESSTGRGNLMVEIQGAGGRSNRRDRT